MKDYLCLNAARSLQARMPALPASLHSSKPALPGKLKMAADNRMSTAIASIN
jgi:hypothetical protein